MVVTFYYKPTEHVEHGMISFMKSQVTMYIYMYVYVWVPGKTSHMVKI
jgi:hypothetical protein